MRDGQSMATPAVCETEACADAGRRGVFLWCGPLFTADPSAPVESRSHQQEGPCWCGVACPAAGSPSLWPGCVGRVVAMCGDRVENRWRTGGVRRRRRRCHVVPRFSASRASLVSICRVVRVCVACSATGVRRWYEWRARTHGGRKGARAMGRVRRTSPLVRAVLPVAVCASPLLVALLRHRLRCRRRSLAFHSVAEAGDVCGVVGVWMACRWLRALAPLALSPFSFVSRSSSSSDSSRVTWWWSVAALRGGDMFDRQ